MDILEHLKAALKWLQDWSGVISLIPLFGILLWPINSFLNRRNATRDRENIKSFLEIKREIAEQIKYDEKQKSYGEVYIVDIRKRRDFTSGNNDHHGVSSGIKSDIMFINDDFLEIYHNYIYGRQNPDETWILSQKDFTGASQLMVCGLVSFSDVLGIDLDGCRSSANDPIIYCEFLRKGILKNRVQSVFTGYRFYAKGYSGEYTQWLNMLNRSHYLAMLKREKR